MSVQTKSTFRPYSRPLTGDGVRAAYAAAASAWQTARFGYSCDYKPPVRYDGGTQLGRRYKAVWPGVEARLRNMGLSELHWGPLAATLFANWPPPDLPDPYRLADEEIVGRYRDRMQRRPFEVIQTLKTELQIWESRVAAKLAAHADPNYARLAVLVDPGVELSPLFRYLAARKYKFHDAELRYRDAALRQYRSDADLYNQHWGALLTPDDVAALGG